MSIETVLTWIAGGLITIGVTTFVLNVSKKYISEKFAIWRKDITKIIELKLKDPVFREMAYKAIIYAQQTFSDLTGEERLKKAIQFAQRIIPGTLDDAIIEGIIRQIYDEIMKPIQV